MLHSNYGINKLHLVTVQLIIFTVGKAKANINSIVTLQNVLSDPCKKIRDRRESLSSKIAELKKKIEKGRLMLSGLQVLLILTKMLK